MPASPELYVAGSAVVATLAGLFGKLVGQRARDVETLTNSAVTLNKAYLEVIDRHTKDIARLDTLLASAQTERAALLLELAAARDENKDLRREVASLRDEVATLKGETV